MEIILTVLGWAAVAASAEVTVSCLARRAAVAWPALNRGGGPVRVADGKLLLPQMGGIVSLSALSALGIHPLLCILGALALSAWAVLPLAVIQYHAIRQHEGMKAARRMFGILPHLAWTAQSFLLEDLRVLTRRHADGDAQPPAARQRPRRADAAAPQPQAAAPAAPAGRTRAIPIPPAPGNPLRAQAPHMREDPELGDPGQPTSIAKDLTSSGVIVPAWYVQAAMMIATSEPDTEDDHLAEIAGDAAGVLALADAFVTRAENLLHGAGLDPAIVAAHFDAAEEVAGLASAFALLYKRYQAVYGDISEAVAGGLILPDQAKTWFSGGTTPASSDEQAA